MGNETSSKDAAELVILGLYGVTAVLSLLGNGMFLLVVMHFRKRFSNTEATLVQLAVSNILLAISNVLIMVDKLTQNSKVQTDKQTNAAVDFFNQASFCSCILLLMCVALHQCRDTSLAQGLSTPRRYLGLQLLVVWLLALLSSIPDALQYFTTTNRVHMGQKMIFLGIFTLVIQLFLTFLLPLVVITVCYSTILQAVRETTIRRRQRVCRMVIALLTTFYIFQLPRAVGTCMEFFPQRSPVVTDAVYIVSTFSCISLIIYAFFWQKFQRKTKELFLRLLYCKAAQGSSSIRADGSST